MKNIAFTIVAKNYIGLAQVLQHSLAAYNAEVEFFIFVADEVSDREKADLPANILIAKNYIAIDEELWYNMAFQYNLVEFCTAIKPFCFQYLLNNDNAEKIIYLDPDIFIFNSLASVFDKLDVHSIILTPHILQMQAQHSGVLPDYLFLVNGIFNLGFLAVKKSDATQKMLTWWAKRLINQCFFDNEKGMATDQKWMNFLPAFFTSDQLHISRDLGLNMAPWNFFERKIIERNNQFYVAMRSGTDEAETPLTFIHFSGFNYKNFTENITSLKENGGNYYVDIEPVFTKYAAALLTSNFTKFSHLPYTYNFFKNGKIIITLHRRFYRRLVEENKTNVNPFLVTDDSFFAKLKKYNLIDHSVASGDFVSNKNLPGFSSKLKIVNSFFSLLQRAIGVRKYSMLSRFFKRYFRDENQLFLIDKNEQGFY